jgi:pimeloyl-ACP methyl ester carboxylesterase
VHGASGARRPGVSYRIVEGDGGVPLNVATAGDPAKPAILLVHGIGQSHVSFEAQLRAPLSDEFHVVSFDLRGHGNSGKPWEPEAYKDSARWAGDVRRVIEALGLERPVLLGWSYGTLVVSDYLRRYGTDPARGHRAGRRLRRPDAAAGRAAAGDGRADDAQSRAAVERRSGRERCRRGDHGGPADGP